MITTIINEKKVIKTEEFIKIFMNTLDVNDKPYVLFPDGNDVEVSSLVKLIDGLPVDTKAIIVINLDKINSDNEKSFKELFESLSTMKDSEEKIILFRSIDLPANNDLAYINRFTTSVSLYISNYIWRLDVIGDGLLLRNLKAKAEELYRKEIELIVTEDYRLGYYYKYDDVYQNIKKYMFN